MSLFAPSLGPPIPLGRADARDDRVRRKRAAGDHALCWKIATGDAKLPAPETDQPKLNRVVVHVNETGGLVHALRSGSRASRVEQTKGVFLGFKGTEIVAVSFVDVLDKIRTNPHVWRDHPLRPDVPADFRSALDAWFERRHAIAMIRAMLGTFIWIWPRRAFRIEVG